MANTPVAFIGAEGTTYDVALYDLSPDSDDAVFSASGVVAETNRKSFFRFIVGGNLTGVYLFIATSTSDGLIDATGYVWMQNDTATKYIDLTYNDALSNQSLANPGVPATAAVTAVLSITTGDDWAIPVTMPFPVDTDATVLAAIKYRGEIISPVVSPLWSSPGANWREGIVTVVFSGAQSELVRDSMVSEHQCCSIEVEVTSNGKTTAHVEKISVRQGLITTTLAAALPGDGTLNDMYDPVNELADRPTLGENVGANPVEDGYRVYVRSNRLTYFLSDGKTAYTIPPNGYSITVDTVADMNALYEIQEEQRVHVRELALAGDPADFYRNDANTAWIGE